MKREIFIGRVGVGGRHPVSLQSMTTTPTADSRATLTQIRALARAGCDIVRVAVPDTASLVGLRAIVRRSPLPVVADIHFDAELALRSLDCGVHGLRINPGNIGGAKNVARILRLANERGVPIRIGVNAGSLEKKYRRTDLSRPEAMVRSALDKVKFCEDHGFLAIKISLKSSHVRHTVEAYRLLDRRCDYPLHVGITEAGTFLQGTVKSAIGIGALLLEGIGNTIRVSLTADPLEEVRVGREILKALQLRSNGIELISCPACARTSVDIIARVQEFEARAARLPIRRTLRVAVMGCEVNGPGEAADADIGIAFSRNHGFIFERGRIRERVPAREGVRRLLQRLKDMA